jgi:hypothetical protein
VLLTALLQKGVNNFTHLQKKTEQKGHRGQLHNSSQLDKSMPTAASRLLQIHKSTEPENWGESFLAGSRLWMNTTISLVTHVHADRKNIVRQSVKRIVEKMDFLLLK